MDKPIVHVINLPYRTDRLEAFKRQATQQDFEYRRWDGIVHQLPFTGIAQAYKRIIQYAKDEGLEMIAIAEDDICFSSLGSYDYFISQIPKDRFDLFLGSIYWGTIKEDNTVDEFSGFTLTVFHNSFYDKFLSTPEQNHIDRQMKIHEGIYKVCMPFVAYQKDGYSDNAQQNTKYNQKYLLGREFYTATIPTP